MNPSRDVLASGKTYSGQINWDYDHAEILADGAVHVIGVCLGLIGAVTIVVIAVKMEQIEVTPILIYVIALVMMLALSAAYNMWPGEAIGSRWGGRMQVFGGPRLLAMGINGN